jgi:hypothetical protein
MQWTRDSILASGLKVPLGALIQVEDIVRWGVWLEAKLVHEPGAGSGEREKGERGVEIVVKNPKIKKFHQK